MDIEDSGDLIKNIISENNTKEKKQSKKKLILKNPQKNSLKNNNYRIYIKTFGCSHNASDSEYMAGILSSEGYEIVPS